MTRKQLTINIVTTVLVVPVVGSGAVTMSAFAAEKADNNDSRETATEMATNSTETGTLETDDVDWYAFEVSVGERIDAGIDLGSDDTTLPTNMSAEFDLYGPSGEEVSVYPNDMLGAAYRPNPGSPSQAWGGLVAEQSGTYYVRVTGKNISDYNVSVSTKRLDQYDPNEQPSSATQIAEDPYELSVTGSGADGTDGSSDEYQNDSGASDGTATTPDDTGSTDENASTGAPDTDGTEQSDSEETGDDAESDADTATQADGDEQTSQSGPGFTGAGAVVGLFVTALFALRRQ